MKFFTVSEVAAQLGIAQVTVRMWIAKRKLGCVRLGRVVRISADEVTRLIEMGTVPACK